MDQARAYLEKLLEALLDVPEVLPDADGDYPIVYRETPYYVRLVRPEEPIAQIFAVAVDAIAASPALAEALNEINGQIWFARIFQVRDQVLVETDILAETLDPTGFRNACQVVAGIARQAGPDLVEHFEGRLPAITPTGATDPAEPDRTVGHYL